ncbi:MAG: hypothetical protein HYS07_10635 [Chlamydiae bacterium]|nr:hypothetical protein [Chlamydiota bacterium]
MGKSIPQSLSPLLVKRFEEETRDTVIKGTRALAVIGCILIPLFGLLDIVTAPRFFTLFMAFRLVTVSLLVIIVAATFYLKRFSAFLGMAMVFSIALMIAAMIRFLGYETSYYAGLSLVILGMGLMIGWEPRYSIICGTIIHFLYLIPILIFDDIGNWPAFVNNNLFLGSTAFVAVVATFLAYQSRWREFLAKANLEDSNRKLQELDQLKNQFFANISHELRTPLTLILAPAESVIKKGEAWGVKREAQKNVEVIRNNALRLLKLVNQLLDLSKIDAGKMELHLSSVQVAPFLKEIQDSVQPLADERGLKLEFNASEDLEAEFDRDQMEKVILNLVYNAVKFTPRGGEIAVEARVE